MEWLRTILDVLAALLLATIPAAFLFWFLIHPLAGFWRRFSPWVTYSVVAAVCLAVVAAIWSVRESLMRVHWGYGPITVGVGMALYVGGVLWDKKVLGKLGFRRLAGLPEISVEAPSRLLTEGPYARVRHPRYLGALIGITGFALIVNYPAIYWMLAASIPVGWLMIVVEERELKARFGKDYEDYARRVPRFIPRWSESPDP